MELIHYLGNFPGNWDKLISSAQSPAAFEQSALWAEITKSLHGDSPIFLIVMEGSAPLASLLCFHQRRKGKSKIFSLRNGSIKWKSGPVCLLGEPEKNAKAIELILRWIDQYARNNHLSRAYGNAPTRTGKMEQVELFNTFRDHGFHLESWGTFQVDLGPDETLIWKNLKHSARKSVNKAHRLGLSLLKIESLEALRTKYYSPYREFELAFGRKPVDWANFEAIWKLDQQRKYAFFVANSQQSQALAVLGMYMFQGVAVEMASALSPKAYDEKIPAQDFLHWEMMLLAKRAGCHSFDLAGTDPDATAGKEMGIRQFKEKWGGEYFEFPRFSKNYHRGFLATIFAKTLKTRSQ